MNNETETAMSATHPTVIEMQANSAVLHQSTANSTTINTYMYLLTDWHLLTVMFYLKLTWNYFQPQNNQLTILISRPWNWQSIYTQCNEQQLHNFNSNIHSHIETHLTTRTTVKYFSCYRSSSNNDDIQAEYFWQRANILNSNHTLIVIMFLGNQNWFSGFKISMTFLIYKTTQNTGTVAPILPSSTSNTVTQCNLMHCTLSVVMNVH